MATCYQGNTTYLSCQHIGHGEVIDHQCRRGLGRRGKNGNLTTHTTHTYRVSSRGGGGEGGHLPPLAIILPPLGIFGVIFNKCIVTTQVMNTTLLIQQSFYLFYSICQLLHKDNPLKVYLETLLLFSLN